MPVWEMRVQVPSASADPLVGGESPVIQLPERAVPVDTGRVELERGVGLHDVGENGGEVRRVGFDELPGFAFEVASVAVDDEPDSLAVHQVPGVEGLLPSPGAGVDTVGELGGLGIGQGVHALPPRVLAAHVLPEGDALFGRGAADLLPLAVDAGYRAFGQDRGDAVARWRDWHVAALRIGHGLPPVRSGPLTQTVQRLVRFGDQRDAESPGNGDALGHHRPDATGQGTSSPSSNRKVTFSNSPGRPSVHCPRMTVAWWVSPRASVAVTSSPVT